MHSPYYLNAQITRNGIFLRFSYMHYNGGICLIIISSNCRWWNVYLSIPLCYYVTIMLLFSQSLSIVLWFGGQLLNVIFSCSSARCLRRIGISLIRVSLSLCHWRHVFWAMNIGTRLIRIRIRVCSASFHLLLPEFDIHKLRLQLIDWSLKYKGVKCPNLHGILVGPDSNVEWHSLLFFDPGMLDGFQGAVNHWLLTCVVFSSIFRGAGACGVAKAIYKQFVFPT